MVPGTISWARFCGSGHSRCRTSTPPTMRFSRARTAAATHIGASISRWAIRTWLADNRVLATVQTTRSCAGSRLLVSQGGRTVALIRIPGRPEEPRPDPAGDPPADLGAVLVRRAEVDAEQHAGLDHLVGHLLRSRVHAFLTRRHVAGRDPQGVREEVLTPDRGGRRR